MARRLLVLLLAAALVAGYLYLTGAADYVSSGVRHEEASGQSEGAGTGTASPSGKAATRSAPAGDPFILLNPARAVYPATVNLAGHRFLPGEEVVVTLRPVAGGDARRIGTTTADKDGLVPNFSFQVPEELGPGRFVVEARGAEGGAGARAELDVLSGTPWVRLDPYAAKPREGITFAAGGFRPGEPVAVYLNTLDGEALAEVTASATGEVAEGRLTLPFAAAGDNVLLFLGRQSNALAQSKFTVLEYTPYGLLGNYTPQPLQVVDLAGEAFVPGESVLVYLDKVAGEPVAILQADEAGKVAATGAFTVPVGLEGEHNLIYVGELSQRPAPAAFTVMPLTPALELTTYAVRPGGWLAFNGRGFAKGETLRAYIGEAKQGAEVSVFRADDEGAFSEAGGFALPYKVSGEGLTVTVVGDVSRTPVTIALGVIGLEPSGDVSAYYVEPGSEVTFGGYGFGAGEEIAVYAEGNRGRPVATARADGDGSFKGAGPYRLPVEAKDSASFTIVGVQTGAEAKVAVKLGPPPTPSSLEGTSPTPTPGSGE